jgi:hypothetical protein
VFYRVEVGVLLFTFVLLSSQIKLVEGGRLKFLEHTVQEQMEQLLRDSERRSKDYLYGSCDSSLTWHHKAADRYIIFVCDGIMH